jgi:HAD superfamily hydrolase (TIGR01450 family)
MRPNTISSCFLRHKQYRNYFIVNGLKYNSTKNDERFLTLKIQRQIATFSSSPSTKNSTTTSHMIRQELLDAATSELQQAKRYYESLEFSSSSSSTNTKPSTGTQSTHQQEPAIAPNILETSLDVLAYLKDIDTLMFDCDGVLYRSPHPTPDVAQAIMELLQQPKPKKLLFVTNNGSVSRSQLQQKITSFLKLPNDLLTADMMITSAYACSQYLLSQATRPQLVFCIGSEGTCHELSDAGFAVINGNSDSVASMTRDDLAAFDFSTLQPQPKHHRQDSTTQNISSQSSSLYDYPKIDAVVIGHDTNFTYRKLCLATVLLQQNPSAILVATNMDSYDITGIHRRHIPGNGALVKAVCIKYLLGVVISRTIVPLFC